MDNKQLAVTIAAELRGAIGDASRTRGLKGIIRLIPRVVKRVEVVGKEEGLAGADKQTLAVAVLLELVPLPWWLPRSIVSEVLGAAIDMAVELLQEKFGKAN